MDRPNMEDYNYESSQQLHNKIHLRDLLDISPTLTEAASAMIDDSFTRCFTSNPPKSWNLNIYLFPLWYLGVIVRYGILFPIRFMVFIIGFVIYLSAYIPLRLVLKPNDKLTKQLENVLMKFLCNVFIASWTAVVKYHGSRPSTRPNQVYVANHSSMVDFLILERMTIFSLIMQKHGGWIGLLQSYVLKYHGCICFERSMLNDRQAVVRMLREHVVGAGNYPLLIFPEGTCENNYYSVMFRKGAFELGATIYPIAIKYNKTFADAFYNSRKESINMFMMRLMTSWAVVCDVWYLEPQNMKPGETPIEFAERVREIISVRAGLEMVPWDGSLKKSPPPSIHREQKQRCYTESLLRGLEEK